MKLRGQTARITGAVRALASRSPKRYRGEVTALRSADAMRLALKLRRLHLGKCELRHARTVLPMSQRVSHQKHSFKCGFTSSINCDSAYLPRRAAHHPRS